MEKTLTTIAKKRFTELEDIIQEHFCTFFYEVGNALAEIRDGELYKETHNNFEDYCHEKWGMSRPRAYQLIKAAEVYDTLSTVVDKSINEAQIRPITKLSSPENQLRAYTRALETAPEGVMTAAHVYKIVQEMKGKPKKERTKKENNQSLSSIELPKTVTGQPEHIRDDCRQNDQSTMSGAMDLATAAISQLELIRDDDPRKDEALSEVGNWINKNVNRG